MVNIMTKETDVFIVFGGAGFLGRYVLRRIARSGAVIRVVGRSPVPQPEILMLGAVGQISMHKLPDSEKDWDDLFHGVTHVINLIGILNESKYQTFQGIHVKLAKKIAAHCKIHNVKKFVHVSALINKGKSNYAISKMIGEKAVSDEYNRTIILRPSLIFGPEDRSINMFASLIRYSPIVPLFLKGVTKFQPVYVDDVARVIERCCYTDDALVMGKVFEVGGRHQYSMLQLFKMIASVLNKKRLFLPIPFWISFVVSLALESCRLSIITRDQVISLKSNSILYGLNIIDYFDIKPRDLRHTLENYIL